MEELRQLQDEFIRLYGGGEEGIAAFHAPGRVNLIGEHTDYNGGYVFPAALTFGTALLIRPRDDRRIGLASLNFPGPVKHFSIDELAYDEADDWMNYPKGVAAFLQEEGHRFQRGYDLLFSGKIPNGAGLSSSASIEVVTGFGLLAMEGKENIDTVQLSLLAQKVENRFIGVNCGIMDQFAVANGKKDHAILLMCDTLEYELVPFNSGAYKVVIANTNKRRGLVDSEYNTRRAQCEQAVRDLQTRLPGLKLLGELTIEQFEANKHAIEDDIVRKRAQHVVEEIDRVKRAVAALKEDDLAGFGRLMNGSHESLRDLYEVSCEELDTLVEEARAIPGTLGSRMTGGGFGGCTVSLVHEDSIEGFQRQVGENYKKRTGLTASFYVADIGDGVKAWRF
ncbi:galactokinase [Paenibacillus sp.]|uniref:galactokinase n=1 Tax=Paenibacillus sp. TaxID=58172 RepID=UPI002D32DED2|nr:galactokinase [Paenibacillus sp.]HZG86483.1 galactokinase [Paenibacillus sp.]